jgi:uncharacterized membrane protein
MVGFCVTNSLSRSLSLSLPRARFLFSFSQVFFSPFSLFISGHTSNRTREKKEKKKILAAEKKP